ncbi:unnamed protein product [Amaranthus hypochondriacus]
MVSFQAPFLQLIDQKNMISETDERNSKNVKRKWNETQEDEIILPFKHWKNPKPNFPSTKSSSFTDVELHLETPLPSEWQRCLDIQSGEIHFYNTRTQKRTLKDPRESESDPPSPRDSHHMSLDLQLNLPCASLNYKSSKSTSQRNTKSTTSSPPPTPTTARSFAIGEINIVNIEPDADAGEMVATACNRCHMLVMLCKSSPTCPNCKYVHPPSQNAS